ncbi:MAG: preprotein translocase subunit SecG [Bacteroidota bacterium]
MIVFLIVSAIVLFILGAFLILLVFLQNPKDQSGVNTFGAGMQQMLGVAHTSNILEKATYVVAMCMAGLVLFISFHTHRKVVGNREKSVGIALFEQFSKEKKGKNKS